MSQLLRIERLAIYRFHDDWSGSFLDSYGFASPPWNTMRAFGKGTVWEDTHLQETHGGRYRKNEFYAVPDIYAEGHSRCHYEVDFLAQIAAQLGVAIQQAETVAESEQRTIALQKSMARQRTLTEVVSKIRSSLDTNLILQTTCQEVCDLLKVERVGVYRFYDDWSGEFISHFGICDDIGIPWGNDISTFGKKLVWEDTHLQDTKGGRYRNNETFAVQDIYQADHTRCHLDILEQFKIRAYALAPIFVGNRLSDFSY